ncbi:hypothetical protein N9M73_02620 [Rhodobacteraceae bacterium]|nr:hypothetical protein [Paracoccaceae bacterium]
MFRKVFIGLIAFGLAGCSDDGQFGLEGSPAWKWRTSEAEQQAYYERFSPYEEVMLNGEILTSNMTERGGFTGNITVSEVKYNGKIYTCRSTLDPMGNRSGECKY